MWIPTEHEKYGVGKFNLPSYSSKKINCFHSRSAVRACVNVRTGGGEVAVLGCWFPAQLETEWLCFYHEASALFQTTQWWELGFHLTATLQSIRLPASPPPLLPPPPSPPDLPNATFLIFLSLARALPYFPIFIMRMWTGELFWLHYCCVFAQALSVSVVVVGGISCFTASRYMSVCVCFAQHLEILRKKAERGVKIIVIIIVDAFSTTEIVPDLEKSWKCVQPVVQCALFRLSEGGLLDQTVKWDKQATAKQTKPNVAKERKPHTDFSLLVWQEFSSCAWIQTQKEKKNPEGEGGGGASYWDAAAERRLKCLIIIFPRDIVLSSVCVCVLLWLSLCKREPTIIWAFFFFFFATKASQPIQSNKTVIC